MPISSTEIQNLIESQTAMFGNVQNYSGQLGQTYGTVPMGPTASFAGGPVVDPRAQFQVQAGQFGVGMAETAVGAGNVAIGGAALAGMFSSGPARYMDPFSGTLATMGKAWQGSAGSGWGLQGSRALGAGTLAMGTYMAAGMAINTVGEAFIQGAQEQFATTAMLASAATRQTMPVMGSISATQHGGQIGQMIQGMAGQDIWTNTSELTGLMGSALQSGMFRGTTSVPQFQTQFRELVQTVRQVADAMNTSLTEAFPLIQQFQGMGYFGLRQAAGAAMATRGMSAGLGLPQETLGQAGALGAHMARQYGLSGRLGADVNIRMGAQLGAGTLTGAVSEETLRDMAGGAELPGAIQQVGAQFAGAALRMGYSDMGTQLLSALVDPETGHIDPARASQLQSGTLGGGALRKLAMRNQRKKGVQAAIMARRGGLSEELLGMVGPETMIMGGATAELGRRGLKPGESLDDVMSMLIQQTSGLGEREAQVIQQLASAGPGLRMEIQQRMQQELSIQKREIENERTYSLEGIKRRLVQKYIDPMLAPVRQLGAQFASWGARVFEDTTNWLLGEPTSGAGGGPGPITITPAGRMMALGQLTGGAAGQWGSPELSLEGFTPAQGDLSIMGRQFDVGGTRFGGTRGLEQQFEQPEFRTGALGATVYGTGVGMYALGRPLVQAPAAARVAAARAAFQPALAAGASAATRIAATDAAQAALAARQTVGTRLLSSGWSSITAGGRAAWGGGRLATIGRAGGKSMAWGAGKMGLGAGAGVLGAAGKILPGLSIGLDLAEGSTGQLVGMGLNALGLNVMPEFEPETSFTGETAELYAQMREHGYGPGDIGWSATVGRADKGDIALLDTSLTGGPEPTGWWDKVKRAGRLLAPQLAYPISQFTDTPMEHPWTAYTGGPEGYGPYRQTNEQGYPLTVSRGFATGTAKGAWGALTSPRGYLEEQGYGEGLESLRDLYQREMIPIMSRTTGKGGDIGSIKEFLSSIAQSAGGSTRDLAKRIQESRNLPVQAAALSFVGANVGQADVLKKFFAPGALRGAAAQGPEGMARMVLASLIKTPTGGFLGTPVPGGIARNPDWEKEAIMPRGNPPGFSLPPLFTVGSLAQLTVPMTDPEDLAEDQKETLEALISGISDPEKSPFGRALLDYREGDPTTGLTDALRDDTRFGEEAKKHVARFVTQKETAKLAAGAAHSLVAQQQTPIDQWQEEMVGKLKAHAEGMDQSPTGRSLLLSTGVTQYTNIRNLHTSAAELLKKKQEGVPELLQAANVELLEASKESQRYIVDASHDLFAASGSVALAAQEALGKRRGSAAGRLAEAFRPFQGAGLVFSGKFIEELKEGKGKLTETQIQKLTGLIGLGGDTKLGEGAIEAVRDYLTPGGKPQGEEAKEVATRMGVAAGIGTMAPVGRVPQGREVLDDFIEKLEGVTTKLAGLLGEKGKGGGTPTPTPAAGAKKE